MWKTLAQLSHTGAEGGADGNAGACRSLAPWELAGASQERKVGCRGSVCPCSPTPTRVFRDSEGIPAGASQVAIFVFASWALGKGAD